MMLEKGGIWEMHWKFIPQINSTLWNENRPANRYRWR